MIELLVVIAIIAILASMLLPALNRAREKAHEIRCMSNQKQIMLAMQEYVDSSAGFFPLYRRQTGATTFDSSYSWNFVMTDTMKLLPQPTVKAAIRKKIVWSNVFFCPIDLPILQNKYAAQGGNINSNIFDWDIEKSRTSYSYITGKNGPRKGLGGGLGGTDSGGSTKISQIVSPSQVAALLERNDSDRLPTNLAKMMPSYGGTQGRHGGYGVRENIAFTDGHCTQFNNGAALETQWRDYSNKQMEYPFNTDLK